MRTRNLVWPVLAMTLLLSPRTALARSCDARDVAVSRQELIDILRRDGFSGVLNEYTDLSRLGYVKVRDVCFVIFVYFHEEAIPGGTVHAATRLLVVRDYQYLGMYGIDDPPLRIKGNTIEFPGNKALGNTIVLNKPVLPAKIYLNGKFRELFK